MEEKLFVYSDDKSHCRNNLFYMPNEIHIVIENRNLNNLSLYDKRHEAVSVEAELSNVNHLGFCNIHLENSIILSLSLVVGTQPSCWSRDPEMAYLRSCPGLEL